MNFTSIIRRLIDCGVDVDLPDNKGQTVVHISAERDNYEALKEIYTVTPYFNQGLVHSLTRLLEVKNYQGKVIAVWKLVCDVHNYKINKPYYHCFNIFKY